MMMAPQPKTQLEIHRNVDMQAVVTCYIPLALLYPYVNLKLTIIQGLPFCYRPSRSLRNCRKL